MRQTVLFLCFILYLSTDIAHAAGMLMRVQQAKAMKQKRSQEMAQEQYQEQQQQGTPTQNQETPSQPTYQQTVDQRNQAIAQAILDAHNQAVTSGSQEVMGNQVQEQKYNPPVIQPVPVMPQQPASVQMGSKDVKDVVDLAEVWKKLDKKSTVWQLLIDDQSKLLTVSEYIDRFHQEGVKIEGPPTHYVQMIDQIVTQNPQMLDRPFGELIQISAIIDYDFDNGMDKDELARKVLGEAGFEANKKRFSQQQQPGQQQQ